MSATRRDERKSPLRSGRSRKRKERDESPGDEMCNVVVVVVVAGDICLLNKDY
jgi:hypothetical protein